MSDALRRMYNAVDRFFDWRAIDQEMHFEHEAGDHKDPITALQAFKIIRPLVRKLDRQARLKLIVSQNGLDQNGASSHWEFFFDLPQRRARLVCDWALPWDEIGDRYGPARIVVDVKPFPAVNGLIRQMVRDGKLLHRQMIGLWNEERRKTHYLPHKFRDSDTALTAFRQQGLDDTLVEYSLSTGLSPDDRPAWIAQTRRERYYAAFDR